MRLRRFIYALLVALSQMGAAPAYLPHYFPVPVSETRSDLSRLMLFLWVPAREQNFLARNFPAFTHSISKGTAVIPASLPF
jgi:hypothetical protein